MTDKQIIIEGIDVSECEFLIISNDKRLCRCIKSDLFGGIEFVENAKNGNCKDNHNCYYKQLKQKEQECKVLALDARVADNHLQHRIEMCDLLSEKLKAKEQECDKLKFNLKGTGILGLMKRNVQLKKALDDIELQIKTLSNRTPLFEIEQIAKDIIKIQDIINKANEK